MTSTWIHRLLLAGLCSAAALWADAQLTKNVTLYKNLSLGSFNASAGNDCWGYVSPSGREYALFSANNKLAFVEVTDPANPVYFANVPHTSSTWGDVKVYQSTAYAVTEAQGTGVQVIDMSDIDNHNVTLVKTLTSPGRTHNLCLDTVSGFLYTCGSRDGTGTTMCFNLANPLNPVRVGSNSITTTYQHDAQVVTYTEGPYAGKQIMFGSGEDRGMEIWDVTNKNSVSLIRRISYPFVGYTHQGWLSPDKKYFYVDDELDEYYGGVSTTRTLVFDVSVLATADLVATYTTGTTSIDHNLYNRNGFVFQADYSSGLRIFDTNVDRFNPPQVGWYDTFPADDRTDFVGAWSNYAFFPSGTVLISDINSGLYIVDVSEATKTPFKTDNVTIAAGAIVSGGVSQLLTVDQQYLVVGRGPATLGGDPVKIEFEGTCLWSDVSKLRFEMTGKVNTLGLQQTLELWDWTTNSWTQAAVSNPLTTDALYTVLGSNPDRFVQQTTKLMKARLSLRQTGPVTTNLLQVSIDKAGWIVNP
ncbi:MAG: choice-of-anchor B family protein [Armatimonadetes bacterium]|nr:choice-of-anchor B family protein [Armatimonadota bacterium]